MRQRISVFSTIGAIIAVQLARQATQGLNDGLVNDAGAIQPKQTGLGATLHMKAIDSGGSSGGTLSASAETIAGVTADESSGFGANINMRTHSHMAGGSGSGQINRTPAKLAANVEEVDSPHINLAANKKDEDNHYHSTG